MPLVPAFAIGVWDAWIFMILVVIQNVGFRLLAKETYQRLGDPPDMKVTQAHKIASYLSMPVWLLATAYSIFLPLKLGTTWFYAGLVVFLFGEVLGLGATTSFAATPANEPVTKGAYRYSRHPLYASLVLVYLSVGIASASWVFLLVAVIWAGMLGISVEDEENYCLKRYGPAYREYMNRTPRWLGIPKQ